MNRLFGLFLGTTSQATKPPVVVEPKTTELILTSGDVLVVVCNGEAPLSWTFPVFPKVSTDYAFIFMDKLQDFNEKDIRIL